jgi:hypothetical protein
MNEQQQPYTTPDSSETKSCSLGENSQITETPVQARKPRPLLQGPVAARRREAMKAYYRTDKGKAAQERLTAKRRHHTMLRKAAKLGERELEDARILGRPAELLSELEIRAKDTKAELETYEHAKARKAAQKTNYTESEYSRHEREKAYKRVYARRKAAEKRERARLASNESGRTRNNDDDDVEGNEMGEDEAVAMAG